MLDFTFIHKEEINNCMKQGMSVDEALETTKNKNDIAQSSITDKGQPNCVNDISIGPVSEITQDINNLTPESLQSPNSKTYNAFDLADEHESDINNFMKQGMDIYEAMQMTVNKYGITQSSIINGNTGEIIKCTTDKGQSNSVNDISNRPVPEITQDINHLTPESMQSFNSNDMTNKQFKDNSELSDTDSWSSQDSDFGLLYNTNEFALMSSLISSGEKHNNGQLSDLFNFHHEMDNQ